MTSFKISRGLSSKLPVIKTDGVMYFCTDTNELFIDYKDSSDVVQRASINASKLDGAILAQTLNDSALEIPSSAVITAIKNSIENSIGSLTALVNALPSTKVVHGEAQELLSNIIETYILNINYEPISFDVTEIVFAGSSSGGDSGENSDSTTAKLGYAILGKMMLGKQE